MKRILSILLCAVLLCSLMPHTVFAADEVLSLSSKEHGEIEVRLTAPAALLVAAAYQNGKMIACETKKDCTAGVYGFSLPASYRYKVFAWDGSSSPLCKALEITDDSSIVLQEETDVTLPTLDDSVAASLGAAVSKYAAASLALLQIQTLFANEEDFAAIKDDHDKLLQYSEMLSETMELLQDSTPSLAALDAVTQDQIDKINDNISLLSAEGTSLQSNEEVFSWAEKLSKEFDALEGNNRVQQLAKNMGCDVKTAYKALTTAQEVLYKGYTADADCYEAWEKAMIAVKATSKVALYVCAVAATAGAATVAAVPAALTTGTVSAGTAAGLMVGAADVGVELGVDAAKIIIGGNAKGDRIIQQAEDQLKPVTDGLLLYSLCTLNSATSAEKLAFLGDIGQRGKEIYDNITLKSDENGALKADIVSLNNSDPSAAAEVAEKKGLPSGENALDPDAQVTVERLEDEHGKDKAELAALLEKEGIIKTDGDFNKLIEDYNKEIVEEINVPKPTPHPDPDPPRNERIVEYYDSETGNLSSVICKDSKGNEVWRRSYENGKVSNFSTNEWDENGDRIQTWTKYFRDPVTGLYTTQIDWVRKSKYKGTSYTNEQLLEEIDYNDNGTIGEVYKKFETYSTRRMYDTNGSLSLDITMYPDHTHEFSYYTTDDPNVPGVDRIGHLQHEYDYYEQYYSEYYSVTVYTVKKEWTAVRVTNAAEKRYDYGWNYTYTSTAAGFIDSGFELVYSVDFPEA